ncbi:MAG: MMPL family transporter [Acidimicrobiaceae bacterium]|nr:MMPL family transporter [Acidimicrobiaceae bacterium]
MGQSSARNPLLVIGTWILLLILVVISNKALGGIYQDNVDISGTQTAQGLNLLSQNDKSAAGFSGLIVIHSSKMALTQQRAVIQTSYANLAKLPDILSVSDPLLPGSQTISKDQRTAYFDIQFSKLPLSLGVKYLGNLDRATRPMVNAGIEVEYGGGLDQLTRPIPAGLGSEGIGFLVALLVLLVSFGSIAGTLLPLATALISVGIGVSLLGIIASVVTFGTASPTLAIMIGLGVGIDYALFLTTRFRQSIINGIDPVTAAGSAAKSSGKAVLIAATSVSIALLGLYTSGITFIGRLGVAAIFGVIIAAAGAITLVPAGLGLLGRRIDRYSFRRPVAESSGESDGWNRYAQKVRKRPWLFLIGGLFVMGILTVPLLSIHIGHVGDGADPTSFTDKRAYDLMSNGFGKGTNGTLLIVVDLAGSKVPPAALGQKMYKELSATTNVAKVGLPTVTPNGKLLIDNVIPNTGPQNQATSKLFTTLVDTTMPNVVAGTGAKAYVTGGTAAQIQFDQILASRLPIIIAVVVLAAFLIIMASFRSIVIAVKAALLNLISIGAAYGVIVAIFQWGWGRGWIGVSENVPIESYVPMMMFAIVFGLSMDYEIFLLSRVKEYWDETRNNGYAVAAGLASTARVITAAALIMVSVFSAFVTSNQVVIKMLALGLAASVLIDATVVRLLLVPAIMSILGEKSWYMPRWLERLVPHIEAENKPVDSQEKSPTHWPEDAI